MALQKLEYDRSTLAVAKENKLMLGIGRRETLDPLGEQVRSFRVKADGAEAVEEPTKRPTKKQEEVPAKDAAALVDEWDD